LRDNLKLYLSLDKTKITHAGTDKANFLGLLVSSPTSKELFHEKGGVKKRASHVRTVLEAPYEEIRERLIDKGFLTVEKGKWYMNAITY
jgi:hypothetical protein